MEITEEQRKRAESNRLAALAKRKASLQSSNHQDPRTLVQCQRFPSVPSATTVPLIPNQQQQQHEQRHCPEIEPGFEPQLPERFRVRLEICSPDSFSVTPIALHGFAYPGEDECLRRLSDCLSNVMPSHYTQNNDEKACVYKLREYHAVLKCLKNFKGIEIEEIPWGTLNVVERLSYGKWMPCRPEHLYDEKVDELIRQLPKKLLRSLLPFQLDGLRYALRRGGRCLIADEMGLGKTIQAIAIACCFMSEGSILVVCPAILRYSWAEELERWLPCLPADIHLVFGHLDNPANLARCPGVVVISYTMLKHLRKTMLEREWAFLIVDESHHVRCSKKHTESEEINAVLDVAINVKRIVLLSGTPSLSRPFDIFHQINMLWPGLLGKSKYDFAKTYCHESIIKDYSKGKRLEELHVLLKQTVMIRRLKEHVLVQLPPKRRQILRLLLNRADINSAIVATRGQTCDAFKRNITEDETLEPSNVADDIVGCRESSIKLSYQQLGIAKVSGFLEWLSIHPMIAESDGEGNSDINSSSNKMIIFAHHHKVMDRIEEFICDKGIGYVRIDGETLAKDRQLAVLSFQSSAEVKIAIVGVEAGGVGLDLSVAHNVVFVELPKSPNLMLQAEDRAHRRGQTNAVNVYIFCAKDTLDELHWQKLNRSLHRVSSTTNGKHDAIQELALEGVSWLETSNKTEGSERRISENAACGELSAKLINLENAVFVQDIQPIKVYNEVAENGLEEQSRAGGSSTTTNYFHTKADVVSRIENCSVLRGKLEVTSEAKKKYLEASAISTGELVLTVEANESRSNQADVLRFEVSRYTGRIHLYSCVSGEDSRPKPLFVNFRPEEMESLDSLNANNDMKTALNVVLENPAYRHGILAFISEWNELRPILQKKLLGKPLQLPLSVELCYLNESINHNSGGLLKGGSKRRTTPSYDISHPLPSNAIWKKVRLSSGYGRKEKEYNQGWTLADEPLCKLCQTPCKNNNAKAPEFFEDLFCKLGCFEEYRIRISNRCLRQELFDIEHGICTSCQLDCHKLVKQLKRLSLPKRAKYIEKVAPKVASRKKLLCKLVNDPVEGNAWHADHIVPIYQGGGECKLENMRTLCVACHYEVTAAQRAERRSMRLKAKKQLKVIVNDLQNASNREGPAKLYELQDNLSEDGLFVKVPGSAYSDLSTRP